VSGSPTLRPAAGELDYVERLLADAGLPTADVRETPGAFHVAVADGERVGCGGVEVPREGGRTGTGPGGDAGSSAGGPGGDAGSSAGGPGLLRSVVIDPARRGEGLGAALCGALAARAADDGVETLYLLTTDAAEFFADLGFERVERAAVPPAVRDTAQFAELCPASATVMRRSVTPE
jgi:amino-acid N-acetyltransferase